MRVRFVSCAVVVLGVLVSSGEAHAGSNAAAAQALFEEARVLMASGSYALACTKLEGSQALDPGPGTEYNLALCYEKSGRTASAWAAYLSAAAAYKATNRPEWETRARDRADALASQLSKITIVTPAAPADLRITRDGAAVLSSEVGAAIPVDPGPHVVEATAEGRPKFSARVELARGASQTVAIVLAPATSDAAVDGDSSSGRKTLAYVLGGAGIVGIAVGAVSGLVAIGKNESSLEDCPQDGRCKSARALAQNEAASDWATVSTVSFIAGGALLAAGAIVFFTAPKKTQAFISPSLGLGTTGVVGAW